MSTYAAVVEAQQTASSEPCIEPPTPIVSGNDDLAIVRNRVISYLLKLNRSIDVNHADLVQAINQRFCQSLMDYLSFGHFSLLRDLSVHQHLLAALESSTAAAVAFNDAYGNAESLSLQALKRDLETLALSLEARFEIEDEIVQNVSGATRLIA